MSAAGALNLEFVESFPYEPEENTLYVSIPFASVMHRCCCGCGAEVVTPLSPTDWKMTFDGVSLSLHPSIGNWEFPCRSHYWIRESKVQWAGDWTQKEINEGRAADKVASTAYFEAREESVPLDIPETVTNETVTVENQAPATKWQVFMSWLRNLIPWR